MVKHIMKGFDHLLSYKDAISIMYSENWKYPQTVNYDIEDSLGKISAMEVISGINIPQHDKSAMDGYAVIARDTVNASATNPAILKMTGINAAGDLPGDKLCRGECREIYTGSIMPSGSDAVVKAEDCENVGGLIYIYSSIKPGDNVSTIGEDIKAGDTILAKNSIIMPQNISAIKATGIKDVMVYGEIIIGIINTGKELVNGQIENSTGILLKTFYSSRFTKTISGGIVNDDKDAIASKVRSLIGKCNIIIVTGGSSLGRRDMTTDALSSEGKLLFSGVSIKPGRTVALFNIKGKPVLSVSGLPVAALLSSLAFINNYIKNKYGIEYIHKSISILDEGIHNKIGFTTFQIAKTVYKGGELHSIPLKTTASGMISALIRGNSIIMVDENQEGIEQGSRVKIYEMGDIKWD
jgi:molybdopterin molybdotransferase